ncbi:MAG: electron transfer flavodomain protein [Gammaproteobacteria bacterium]|jgi:electron transfer flavoprotein alpha subunit|nr:electron transfer flavodomain protein [Gammaproteobacteria bacterium]
MNKILVVAELDQNGIKKSTRCTIAAAKQLNSTIELLIAGSFAPNFAEEAAKIEGISQVICDANACYDHGIAENFAQLVLSLAKNYTHVLAPASSFGKDFMPRVAALLNVAQVSEITAILDDSTFIRPIYAGNAFAKVKSQDAIKLITVRSTAFDPANNQAHAAPIQTIEAKFEDSRVTFIKAETQASERPTLENARVVISGGRAFQSKENFDKLLEPLAEKLNAAIGASRAAVDAGYAPNDYQVGQTGKVVAPELYIAIGISGAVQHLAGMNTSKVIVAINKDADASIFQIADYGLVGDLYQLIPELTEKL